MYMYKCLSRKGLDPHRGVLFLEQKDQGCLPSCEDGPKRRQLLTDPQYSRQDIVSRADGRAIAVNGANILAARLQVLGAGAVERLDSAWTRGVSRPRHVLCRGV